jgi:hypothetical protein
MNWTKHNTGLLGWRRKKKTPARAAWPEHQNEIRRGRREAAFLFRADDCVDWGWRPSR